jgi:hypothetical protein
MAQVLLNMASLLLCGVVVHAALDSPSLPNHRNEQDDREDRDEDEEHIVA